MSGPYSLKDSKFAEYQCPFCGYLAYGPNPIAQHLLTKCLESFLHDDARKIADREANKRLELEDSLQCAYNEIARCEGKLDRAKKEIAKLKKVRAKKEIAKLKKVTPTPMVSVQSSPTWEAFAG